MGIFDSLARLFHNSKQNEHSPGAASKRKTVKSYLFGTLAAMLLAFVAFSGNAITEAAAVINYNATEVHTPENRPSSAATSSTAAMSVPW